MYESLCKTEITSDLKEADDPILEFNKIIINIVEKTIPKTSTNPNSKSNPWHDADCKKAIQGRKKAERRFKKHPTGGNLNMFRINRAKARRVIKSKRRLSWRNFVSKVTSKTPMRKVWNMIQKLKGKNSKAKVQHLKEGNTTLTSLRV